MKLFLLFLLRRRGDRIFPGVSAMTVFSVLLLLMEGVARAGGIITNCNETSLRAAMAGGGTVTFACDGTITLAGTISNSVSTVLDATGHQITIGGGNAVRAFYVGTNSTLILSNLTIVNCCLVGVYATSGYSPNDPRLAGYAGAILNFGTLLLQDCVFSDNQAIGTDVLLGYGGNAQGGAIVNLGTNFIDHCLFQRNVAKGGRGGGSSYAFSPAGAGYGEGGAIYNAGYLSINRSLFSGNLVSGGSCSDSGGYDSFGNGYNGNSGKWGCGGAIYSVGSLLLQNSTVVSNRSSGGDGGAGGNGAPTTVSFGVYTVHPGGSGGSGGFASGGLWGSSMILVNDTVAFDVATGGRGAAGGKGGAGNPPLVPSGPDGAAGVGGSSDGGISGGHLTNCTVAFNSAVAGSGGSPGGSAGVAVGGVNGGVLFNTLLASNTPLNLSSAVDAGYNLSSDASAALTATGSRTNINPLLGPLANNGGPTLTMALLPGSPAIDAGSTIGAPATDQRGITRPQGPGVDIGAYEFQYLPSFSGIAIWNGTNCQWQLTGLWPNANFTVQASSNLVRWFTVTNCIFGTNGGFQFVEPVSKNLRSRFYRITTP